MAHLARRSSAELKPMVSLAIPVVLAELGWMAMGVVDTMMVGRIGAEAIGGLGLGRVLFFTVTVFGMGLLLGLDTLVSTSFGAGRIEDCHRSLVHGTLGFMIALPMTALLLAGAPFLDSWGLDAGVLRSALPYLRALTWSALPLLLYTTFRRYLQAMSCVRPVMIALTSANLVNAFANWVLIFGNLGAPALDAEGAGWATTISSWYMALFLALAIWLKDRDEGSALWRTPLSVEARRIRRLLALGFPAATHLVLEVGVFATATALAGRLDAFSLAAHQIALIAASVTFMVPLGISSAAAVRVGQALGAGRAEAAARAGWTALVLGGGFMLLAGALFLLAPRPIARLFTDDPRVLVAAVSLLAVAAFFQLSDGLQVVATGALRGAGDTRTPMMWSLIAHWLVGLPIGWYLCFERGQGVVGLWIGLLVSLTLIGIVLLRTWRKRSSRFETLSEPGLLG